jgi:type II secretion system protein L
VTDLVVLKLGQSLEDPVAWGAFSGGSLGEAGRVANVAALSQIAHRIPADVRIVAIAPGEQVAAREIPSPPKQPSKLQAAAAYLFEDDLAEPIEDIQIATQVKDKGATAFAVSKSIVRYWLDGLSAAGVTVTELTPDFACLGGSATACVFAADGRRVIASRGVAGFAAEQELAEVVAPSLIDAAGDATIVAYGAHEAIGRWTPKPVERRPLTHEADLLSVLGANLAAKGQTVNLLTGEFRRKTKLSFKLGPYRRVAGLAAGVAVAALFWGAASGLRDARVASRYEETAAALHKAAFPTFAGSDIRAHAREIVAGGGSAARFLDLNSRLSAGVASNDGVAIERLRFDSARGLFTFSIRSSSDAGIEAFRASLDGQGLVATDNGGYRRIGDSWTGEMTARLK